MNFSIRRILIIPKIVGGDILRYYIKRYYVVDAVLYHHIVNYNSILQSSSFEIHKDRLQVELMKLEELKNRDLCDINSAEIVYGFISRYYLNTLHLWFSRDAVLDYNILNDIQREVRKRYPDYLHNEKICKIYPNYSQIFLLATLGVDINDVQWEEIKKSYCKEEYDYSLFLDEDEKMHILSILAWHWYKDIFAVWNDMTDVMLSSIIKIREEVNKSVNKPGKWKELSRIYLELIAEDKKLEDTMIKTIYEWTPKNRNILDKCFADVTYEAGIEQLINDIISYLKKRKMIYEKISPNIFDVKKIY